MTLIVDPVARPRGAGRPLGRQGIVLQGTLLPHGLQSDGCPPISYQDLGIQQLHPPRETQCKPQGPTPSLPKPWIYLPIESAPFIYIMRAQSLNCVQLFATLWTVAHQASLSVEFSKQEH